MLWMFCHVPIVSVLFAFFCCVRSFQIAPSLSVTLVNFGVFRRSRCFRSRALLLSLSVVMIFFSVIFFAYCYVCHFAVSDTSFSEIHHFLPYWLPFVIFAHFGHSRHLFFCCPLLRFSRLCGLFLPSVKPCCCSLLFRCVLSLRASPQSLEK